MRHLAIDVNVWRVAMLAALTTPLTGCGGTTGVNDGPAGAGGNGAGGASVTSGGSTSNGGGAGHAGVAGSTSTLSHFGCVGAGEYAHSGSGYEQCTGGFVHRHTEAQCVSTLVSSSNGAAASFDAGASGADGGVDGGRPAPDTGGSSEPPNEWDTCALDAECNEKPHGQCGYDQFGSPGRYCQYGCVQDSECDPNSICLCGEDIGHCVPADCTTDADCEGGALCTAQINLYGCGVSNRFVCQSPQDDCMGSADCAGGSSCEPTADGRRCQPQCVYGRPFLVSHEVRQANAVRRSDWLLEARGDRGDLSPTDLEALARHWTDTARMEHASIAAFARFSLQLLSLGAPASLLEATHRALEDETRHARLAFGLASRFRGQPVGPGPLSLEGAMDDGCLEAIVVGAVVEGCIGETLASLEAAEALALARDPEVVATLEGVHADERRHAELSWQFVRWAMATFGAPVTGWVEHAFDAGLAAARNPATDFNEGLEGYGLLSGQRLRQLRQAAVDGVLRPCRDQLLNEVTRPAPRLDAVAQASFS